MITLFGNEKEKKEPSLLERLKQSVSKTRTELAARAEQLLTGNRPVDPELLRQLCKMRCSPPTSACAPNQRNHRRAAATGVNEHKLVCRRLRPEARAEESSTENLNRARCRIRRHK